MALPSTYVKGFHDEEAVGRMEYRRFGHTGMVVSKLAIGGATFSNLFGPVDEEEGIATIHKALRQGINYVDTAPYYGQGKSEELIGKALKTVPRKAYYLTTKVGRYERDPKHAFDYSAKKTRESLEKSLKLLGILNETLPMVEALKKEGKVRHIGVSAYPIGILKEIITKAPGRFDTVLCYSRYTLADDTLLDYIPFFKEQKVTLICAAVHAIGLLTNQGALPTHPASQELKDVCLKAAELCKANGVELGKLAMYYALQLEGPAIFLVGVQNRKQLDSNVDALLNGLSDEEKKCLKVLKEEYFTKSWNWEGVEIEAYWKAIKGTK
ncbi:unnamed protein product [Hermetia illucens]|uniref:NADP-dependent oxidoreductase domain-containing protein n=1 Tax=Hermetia illucens TaxID=343691 RepID=A0A7R8V647_HERIL|nr:unnamed protein product [Hermetia illucens]